MVPFIAENHQNTISQISSVYANIIVAFIGLRHISSFFVLNHIEDVRHQEKAHLQKVHEERQARNNTSCCNTYTVCMVLVLTSFVWMLESCRCSFSVLQIRW